MMEQRITDPENGSTAMPRRMFMRMFPPSLISAVAMAFANIADALVVGNRMGEMGLATIGLATPVYLVFNLVGAGFAVGGGIMHSRLTAAEARDRALCHFRRLSGMLLLIGLTIAALGNVFMPQLLTGLGAGKNDPVLREMVEGYLRPLVTATPLIFLNFLLYFFIRNDDQPDLASLGNTVSSILDLVLNIVFVLFLHMGVKGAIYGTILAQTVCAVILSTHLFFGRKGILRWKAIVSARAAAKDIADSCRDSLRTGFSSSVSFLFQFLFLLLGNHLLLSAGQRGMINGSLHVAVFDLVLNCSFVMISVYQAAMEAMQPLTATFAVEHDRRSLRFLLRTALMSGLIPGVLIGAAAAVFVGGIARVFGLTGPEATDTAVAAIRIYLLSTPLAGILMILTAYDQSTGTVQLAMIGTLLRTAGFLLPVTLLLGLFCPAGFWWLYPVTETLSLAVLLPLRVILPRRSKLRDPPVFSRTVTNSHRELGEILESMAGFCETNGVPEKLSVQLQLAVEELCAVTMEQAFSGKPGEYIRINLAVESGPKYVLHIRNSAPFFNPLDMKMEKAREDMKAELMDSIGVMMVRKMARSLSYRNYQGYNVLTAEFEERG